MKSYQVIDFGRPLRETELADPKPTGDEVVVEVKAAGVCHSDLHIWEGSYDLGHGKRLDAQGSWHSAAADDGPRDGGRDRRGRRRKSRTARSARACSIYPWIGCGVCRVCREGQRKPLHEAALPRRSLRRRLCRSDRRAALEISAAARRPRSGRGRALRLFGRHDLFGAEEIRRRSSRTSWCW